MRENLTLALLPRLRRHGIVDRKRQTEIVDRFIRAIGIKCSSPDQPIRELSGGNQQKVLLARWLCTNPKLLILDEPTRGIDVGAKRDIQVLVRQLADDGLAVLLISSELEEIIADSDRVVTLRDGRSVAELTGDQITEDALMQAMATGPPPTHAVPTQDRSRSDPRIGRRPTRSPSRTTGPARHVAAAAADDVRGAAAPGAVDGVGAALRRARGARRAVRLQRGRHPASS